MIKYKTMKILKFILLNLVFLSVISLGSGLKAQVTIGSGLEPNKGALLDLKEKDPVDPVIDNSTADKGLAIPRISLTSMTTLVDINGAIGKEIEHTGLMVYNLSASDGFEPGIYVWDGTKWVMTKASDSASGNGRSLDGNGGVKLANASSYSGADVILRNSDGPIGTAAVETPVNKVLCAQSVAVQNIDGSTLTSLNAGEPVVVTWSEGDIQSRGGLLTRNDDHSFTFNEKALCKVSGYVDYHPNITSADAYAANHNDYVVIIQYAAAAAPNNWITLAGARHQYSDAATDGAMQSVSVSAAIRTFNKNDKIRMIVKRPSSSFGIAHETLASEKFASNVLAGSTYSKSLKVITL